jgi:hypothetical protein
MTLQEALDELDALGSTPDEIAIKLAPAGIVGKPQDPCHCIIANWVKRKTSKKVSVNPRLFYEPTDLPNVKAEGDWCPLSTKLNQFALAFDNHNYPWLEEQPLTHTCHP